MIKIVSGNDIKLQFPFFERLEDGRLTPLDVSELKDLKVKFIRTNGTEIDIEKGVSLHENKVAVVVPCYTELGKYHVSISGMLGNAHVCSMLKECFAIVQFNSDGNYTDSRMFFDPVIESSVLVRVDVDEHVIPTDEEEEGDGSNTEKNEDNEPSTTDNGDKESDENNTDEPLNTEGND